MSEKSEALSAILFLAYVGIAVLTYGHSLSQKICHEESQTWFGCASIFSPAAAIGWPLYWSYQFQKPAAKD